MNKPGSPDRPTMEKVAELAGVSKITVSRALRGSDLVRAEVRERVVRIAEEIGYRINLAARTLRTNRTRTIAVLVEQLDRGDRPIADPLLLLIIGGLLEALAPADYAMLLTTKDHFLNSNAIGADGVVMVGQGEGAQRLVPVKAFGLPMIVWGEPVPGLDVAVIGSDNRGGGKLAAEHLVAAGRKRLLFLGDPEHPEVAARLEGFREVLAASEAALAAVIPCPFTADGGAEAVGRALDEGARFDAIFAASDFIAAGACDALFARGMTVPGEVAVVGFDDTPIAAAHRPAISSIRQDAVAAGRALGTAIVRLVEQADGESPASLPVELIVRETS